MSFKSREPMIEEVGSLAVFLKRGSATALAVTGYIYFSNKLSKRDNYGRVPTTIVQVGGYLVLF